MERNPSGRENMCEKHEKTIGGSVKGPKPKIFGATPDHIKWGYRCPSNPLLTTWKEYNTTQQYGYV